MSPSRTLFVIAAVSAAAAAVPQVAGAEPQASVGARSEPGRWRFTASIDADTLLQHGIAGAVGIEPAALPRWRFSLVMASHDVPDALTSVSGKNEDLYVSMPIAIELGVQHRTRSGLVLGARAGVVHLHFARIGTFGIDEEFDYGVTPYVGYHWEPIRHVYVQPWLGAMATLYRQRHGELPMDEADRDYAKWTSAIRGGLTLGAIY